MKWLNLTVLLVLMSAQQFAVAVCSDPSMFTLESVVRVHDSNGVAASGVVIANGLVLTAAHVVDSDGRFSIERAIGGRRDARLVSIDLANDLALLTADTNGIPTVSISSGALGAGDQVWAAGYPRNGDLTISEGSFQNEAQGRVHTNAYIDSGQSGGALLRCDGNKYVLAGIVHGFVAMVLDSGYANTGESISIAAATLHSFLGDAGDAAMIQ